ncbi:MAG: lipopolysaccharide core heptose(II) kinase RfaY [Syntrophomonadaceae bacterium]|nr:lipopolysaccharide core heptose(II) kinase RfaY [Syntrophomonadaceae bacterium]
MGSTLTGGRRFRRLVTFFVRIVISFMWLHQQRLWHDREWLRRRGEELSVKYARRYRDMAIEMGGITIKLGQFFSTRVDIFPAVVVKELAGLQDEVQAVPFAKMEPVFISEFGRPAAEVFAWIDQNALAAASLGQVHEGRLHDGTRVAIKILRPGIEHLTHIDLRVIRIVLRYLQRKTRWGEVFDLDLIYQEFYTTVMDELDYRQEGKNAEQLAHTLSNWPELRFPTIYWEYSRQRVLTMQYMEGVKISDIKAIDALGADRKKLAQLIMNIYCQQILIDGFYHADPHPGNLLVSPEGNLVLLDFGMVGHINPLRREQMMEFCLIILKQDYVAAAEQLKVMGFLRPFADVKLIGRLLQAMIDIFMASRDMPDNQASQRLMLDIEELVYEQPFQIPDNYVFIGRAGSILLGIGVELDPDINFIESVRPWFERMVKKERPMLLKRLAEEGSEWLSTAALLPGQLKRVLTMMEQGRLNVTVQQQPLVAAINHQTRALNQLSRVVFYGIIFGLSCYLLVNGWEVWAHIGFGLSFLILLWVIVGFRHQRLRHRDKR